MANPLSQMLPKEKLVETMDLLRVTVLNSYKGFTLKEFLGSTYSSFTF